ncbi:MAG: hypothetical protein HFH86_01200 [Bacilli bacterium]|jgi:hypothetical protein|nr:hypothetical protein [Bacilli bacterium]
MFTKCDFKTLQLKDGEKYVGLIRINDLVLQRGPFTRPFQRETNQRIITSIGKRDYNQNDQYIIAALNDYYKQINMAKNAEERNQMLENYNRLYNSWMILNQAKATHQYKVMEDAYDEISYQLYLIGYKLSNH